MGNSCGCVGGGEESGGRGDRRSLDGSGGRGDRRSLDGSGGRGGRVDFMTKIDRLRAASVIEDTLYDEILKFQQDYVRSPGEVRDQSRLAPTFIKGTCSLNKHEDGEDTGGEDGGGAGRNHNNIQ